MNTRDMLLSVIVPVYNVEQYLGQCVESILGQTYPHLEVILVNDGSTDGSGKLCDAYAAQDPRVKVIHTPNGKQSTARNIGLDVAKGDYITFVDSDDWLETDAYELCVEQIKQRPDLDILMFAHYRNEGDKQEEYIYPYGQGMNNEQAIMALVDRADFLPAVMLRIFKREAVENIRFFAGRVYEDVSFPLEVHLNVQSFYYYPRALYHYRANEGSTSYVMKENIIDLFLNLQDLLYRIKDSHPEWVPLVNATRIRWLQAHYDEICVRQLRPERFAPIFADMRRFPFSYANRQNYWARWFFIHFPKLYSWLKHRLS